MLHLSMRNLASDPSMGALRTEPDGSLSNSKELKILIFVIINILVKF